MTTVAAYDIWSPLVGEGSRPAGDLGLRVSHLTRVAFGDLKAGRTARTSYVFNDLCALANEHGLHAGKELLVALAQRFLLALPTYLPAPELSLDDDGEISFDWRGRGERILTVTLREDGRLSFAVRIHAFNKRNGVALFDEEIPDEIIDFVHRVAEV